MTRMVTETISASEAAVLRTIRSMIQEIINNQFDAIIETSSFNIEDHRDDIETMISEWINNKVSINIEG